ncbi:hypothetical protein EJ06DRAFT_272136 [Trichodelitschia bisporula]|uniref:Uncharacterized protein n=1 Tax=Trichodelitschia bisporula TaxID=703511 RepID=A0A6G1I554_9PEZI|nr:hypothetical protein EJ06DRAFT_272136 [Trichodelitschia bisporula]
MCASSQPAAPKWVGRCLKVSLTRGPAGRPCAASLPNTALVPCHSARRRTRKTWPRFWPSALRQRGNFRPLSHFLATTTDSVWTKPAERRSKSTRSAVLDQRGTVEDRCNIPPTAGW